MSNITLILQILKSPVRYGVIAFCGLVAGTLRGESAQYSFDGMVQGELPLEVEFLSLARKHGLNVRAMVSGSLSVRSARTIFDSLGTSSVELKLFLGEIQELTARLQSDTFYQGLHGNVDRGAQVQFGSSHIAVRDPNAFPARIGLPSPTGQDSAFVLEGISLRLDPIVLGQLGDGVEEPVGTLTGKIRLKKEGGSKEGEIAELDFTVTNFKKQGRSLWDSPEWRSVATVMERMNTGMEADQLPVMDDFIAEGEDGLIVIPEPATFGFLAALLGGAFVLLQRRRHTA